MSTISSDRRFDPTANQDGLAKKRRKGANRLSCAECRRLKLRCDRAIPCSSCIKRGCGAICPDGSLTTGQGNRFVLASTQELHEKISQLANRVRQLEDGLRESHAQLSSEQHPLLEDELLRIKAPLQREAPSQRNPAPSVIKEEDTSPDVDAFGSLSISVSGRAKFFGTTANSWYFLQNESPEDEEQPDHIASLENILPREILARASAFPIASAPQTSTNSEQAGIHSLLWYLPPAPRALQLRSIYYSHAAWMYNPVSAESFDSEVYAQFYDTNAAPLSGDPLVSHRLGLLFMVLAIGSLMDTTLPAYNLDAERFHQLARAALFQDPLFDEPTITAVQALYLMTFYLFLVDRHGTSSGARWAITGIAVKISQSIGLHRDSGRWKVDTIETQRRRELFWELFTLDSWQCFTFGRPPSFALPHIDCKMPYTSNPSDEQCFHAWKHQFASECMNLLHDQAFGAKMPTYATVLQLDRKMRAFPVPAILQVAGFGSSEPRPGGFPDTIMLTLQRHIVLAIREMNLLYLHRSFFARAISDHPKDPLGSPYGTSVIAAYRSAGSLVALMRNLHTQLKEPSERMWFLWTHMFSCAIILGSIVTRCPSLSLAPSALVQLNSACELFSKAARGFRAEKVLNIMLGLQERAHLSLEEFRNGKGSPLHRYGASPESPIAVNDIDELSILGGKTRLVAKKEPSSPTLQLVDRSPTSHNPVVPFPPPPDASQFDDNVIAYLRSFDRSQTLSIQQHSPISPQTAYGEEQSPMGMYGMASFSTPFHQEPQGYEAQAHSQSGLPPLNGIGTAQQQTSHHQGMMATQTANPVFPQYFPVFDYGAGVMGNGPTSAPLLNSPSMRQGTGSPEATMDGTWNEFVAGLKMQG